VPEVTAIVDEVLVVASPPEPVGVLVESLDAPLVQATVTRARAASRARMRRDLIMWPIQPPQLASWSHIVG